MESRIDATDRLRAEGRWAEASQFRDEVIRRLRASGVSRKEANELAWGEMLDRFPPLEDAAGSEGLMTDHEWPTTPITWDRMLDDIAWTYQHLDADVQPKDAPSSGAWGLLYWARQYPGDFFTKFLLRLSATVPNQGEDVDSDCDEDDRLPALRSLMRIA